MDQNENKNNQLEIDPDYESTNTALRRVEFQEDVENKLTEEKIKTVIQEEFDKELQLRQKQLEEIEDTIFKAQKLLHIVRYVLISSFYNCKTTDSDIASTSANDPSNLFVDQKRIHPAVKRLLGDNANNIHLLLGRGKRKSITVNQTSNELSEPKRIKLETGKNSTETATATATSNIIKVETEKNSPLRKRTKVQYKVIIGNISYFKKSLEQNNTTHKWMVYVKLIKGFNNSCEVTNDMLSKVIFYLHPSYKPHDVVEISQPPYHLSRRGWGEFPLRLKICFKSPMNKPVDVIHQLKLDNTFTERQTLGNQTTVPIFLYDDLVQSSDPITNSFIKKEDELASMESKEKDHDYCDDNDDNNKGKQEVFLDVLSDQITTTKHEKPSKVERTDVILRDHAYSLPLHKEGQKSPKKNKSPIKQAYNELIYGLGPHYLDPLKSRSRNSRSKNNIDKTQKDAKSSIQVLKTVTGQSIHFLPDSFNQLLLTNGNLVSVKLVKSPKTIADHSSQIFRHSKGVPTNPERDFLKLPEHKFKNMGEVLPYLFKKLPLWTSEANNLDFKCTYPFCARSEQEYLSWNVGKRLSSEWSRAKLIKRIVSTEPCSKFWTTKAIFMYGRSHSYTPMVKSYKLFQKESQEKQLILNCYQNECQNGVLPIAITQNDEPINISSPEKSVINHLELDSTDNCLNINDQKFAQECAFIKETALDCGVILKPEKLVPGVTMNTSERIILEAVKCFAENLIRRSRNRFLCQRNSNNQDDTITCKEIEMVLEERKEFQTIKKFKEKKMTMDFFS